MIRTDNYYRVILPYNGENGQVVVIGVNDLVLITTECNGKCYEKLNLVKQYKTKTPDEACKKAVEATCDKLESWMYAKSSLNGQDFYKHGIKTNQSYNGLPLGGYFEMVLEDCYS